MLRLQVIGGKQEQVGRVSNTYQHPYPRCLLRWIPFAGMLLGTIAGCNRGPSRIAAPDWDPSTITERAFSLLDTNQDGVIGQEELGAAPGLASAKWHLDANKDGNIDREELQQRFQLYEDMGTGLMAMMMRVTYYGRPLPGAEVRLIPEQFLEGVIEPASGVTDLNGMVTPRTEIEDLPAVRVGFYRVEVTSPHFNGDKAKQAASSLGVEASPVSDGEYSSGTVELAIGS